MEIVRKLAILTLFLVSLPLHAENHVVEMLSSSNGQMMVFKPAVLKIQAGDTVTWKATNPGHNTASISEMSPDSSLVWNGKINEELTITFSKEGTYGYKCTPHYILGMVGIIAVGDVSVNYDTALEYGKSQESKWATNKERFSQYLSEIK